MDAPNVTISLAGWSRYAQARPPAVLELLNAGMRIVRFFGADTPEQALAAWQTWREQGGNTAAIPYIVREEELAWRDIEEVILDVGAEGSLTLPFTRRKALAGLLLERRAEFTFVAADSPMAEEIASRIRAALAAEPGRESAPWAAQAQERLGPLAARVRQAAGRLGRARPRHDLSENAAAAPDLDLLERLAELRDRGILTPDEFEAKKRQILGL
jgi:hypothetical protein